MDLDSLYSLFSPKPEDPSPGNPAGFPAIRDQKGGGSPIKRKSGRLDAGGEEQTGPAPDVALIAFEANISGDAFRVALLDPSSPAASVSVAGVSQEQLLMMKAGRVWDTDPAARVRPPRLGLVLGRAADGIGISARVLLAGLSNTDLEDIERGALSIAALRAYAICIREELPAFRPHPDRPRRGCERCSFYQGDKLECPYSIRQPSGVPRACGHWKQQGTKSAKQSKVKK